MNDTTITPPHQQSATFDPNTVDSVFDLNREMQRDVASATDVSDSAQSTNQDGGQGAVSPISQALEDQNIFYLLGVTDGSDEDREAFLDELQEVIWEDFLEKDVELLVTEEELAEMKKIMSQKGLDATAMQEKVIEYLEKLIPDLEEIMLEKALELKEDMVRERIAGLRQYFTGKTEQLDKLAEAERLIHENQWRSAAEVLNGLQ